MIEAELKVTGDAYNRASAGKKQAELENVMDGTDLRENYRAFLEMLEKLLTENALGKQIIVNGLDCEGTLIVNADGSISENRLTGIRRKTFRYFQR